MLNRELYGLSNSDIVRRLGRRYRQYRISSRMKQADVARQAGVSVFTLSQFENGRAGNITLTNLIALLRAIEALDGVDELLPELPMSPYELEKIQKKEKQRVRDEK